LFIFLLIGLIALLIKRFLKPIKELSVVTLEIANGNTEKEIYSDRDDEIGMLIRNFDIMRQKMKEREKRLKEAVKNIKTLIENLPFSIIQFNTRARPDYINKHARKLILKAGNKIDDKIFHKNWLRLVREKYIDSILEVTFKNHIIIESDDQFKDTKWMVNPLKELYVQSHFIQNSIEGKINSITGLFIDLTESKQNEKLRIEKRSADLANEIKSEFLARMSHEIRTPLNVVIGFADLALRKYQVRDHIYSYLLKIKHSAAHLLDIINDILNYSKIAEGKMELEKTEFDISTILFELFDIYTSLAHKRHLEFILSHSPLIPTSLFGDPVKIKQVLFNLVSNALKFTKEGEIHVHVDLIKFEKNKVKLRFFVKDTGIGISEEQAKRLFQPFVQADGTINRRFGGTGIGLTISKKIVQLMNGDIWFESKEGKGTTFWFEIELETKSKKESLEDYFKKFKVSKNIENIKVLVCDDNETTLKIIKTILVAFKFKVTAVNNGIKVVNLLEEGNQYDLLIIDKVMLPIDGFETMQKIKEKNLRKNVNKVIMLSAYDEETDVSRLRKYGIDMFKSKPIDYSSLFDSIIKVFNKKEKDTQQKKKRQGEYVEPIIKMNSCKVLLVDDNELNLEVAGDLMEIIGLRVDFAKNGQEALEKIKASGRPSSYCMVFMDLQMPIMDGFTATQNIRSIPAYKDLPIIAMTADVMPGVKEKCFSVGMNDFLSKPIDPTEVVITITKWIKSIDLSDNLLKTEPGNHHLFAHELPIKHLDLKQGVNRIGGKVERFISLLIKFKDHYQDFVKDFYSLDNKEEQLRLVHTFKGLTGNISAVKLHYLVIELEKQMKANNDYENMLNQVEQELKEVIMEIETLDGYMKKDKKENQSAPVDLIRQIEEIKQMLKDYNPDATEKIKEIQDFFKEKKEFEKIITYIEQYEYEKALEIFEQFKF
jgi:signal transduction histidine kinase/CheY-like chemotaxis protein/HAMP domain-containing protein